MSRYSIHPMERRFVLDTKGIDLYAKPAEASFRSFWSDSAPIANETYSKFYKGQRVRKIKGAQWQGRVVGWYNTDLTPEGYAVESETEKGSVQIYPAAALEAVDD